MSTMSLNEAIDILGKRPAAKVAGVAYAQVQHWYRQGRAPAWRMKELGKIIRAAERKAASVQQDKAA